MRWMLLLALLALPALVMACDGNEPDAPVSATPGGQPITAKDAPLHEARLDAAKRADVAPLEVRLKSVRAAGFDGCLGVTASGQACTEQFIGGYIAVFDAGGKEYRYHFGGDKFVYADATKATISDGMPVPPETSPDLNRELAAYAREDLELRLRKDDAVVTAIIPAGFPNGCMGFLPQGQDVCDTVIIDGAVVFLLGPDSKTYRYHVGSIGVIATDFEKGEFIYEPEGNIRVSQQLMRQDLARRLSVPVDKIQLVSYRKVTWPDGCLGVYKPDTVCTQALVDGFLALLAGPDGKTYRYHGGPAGDFVAAAFEPTARIGDPTFRDGS